MKKRAKRLLAMLLCLIMVFTGLIVPVAASGSSSGGNATSGSMTDVSEILDGNSYNQYIDDLKDRYGVNLPTGIGEIVIDGSNFVAEESSPDAEIRDYHNETGVVYTPNTGSVVWEFNVEHAGMYLIEIEYCQIIGSTNSIERVIYINGEVPFSEARSVVLTKNWVYDYQADGTFASDINGNDIRPSVVESLKWQTYQLSDSNGYISTPFEFYFAAGTNRITLEGQREAAAIKSITLKPYEGAPTYREYLQINGGVSANKVSADRVIRLEAEAPSSVSAVTMYPVYDRTSAITTGLTGAQSAKLTKYNTFGKEQWQNAGERVSYTIEVEEEGYYSIAMRYKQSLLSGMYVSRKVYIDGELPFKEAANCRFPYSSDWQSTTLTDGSKDFMFYLEEGEHTITFEVGLGEMGSVVESVSASLSNINSCYLEILKLTGSDPDTNRSYGFSRVMPDVLRIMLEEYQNLKEVYDSLVETSGKSEKTSTIEQTYILLQKMSMDESTIAGNLANLKSQIGALGTWINSVKTQPLQVDYICVQSGDAELPVAEAGFFKSLWYEIRLFFASFSIDYNSMGVVEGAENTETIEVWVVTGRDQAQIIRNLVDNEFTPEHNISVNLKLVSAGTLLPSVLAKVGPDVSLMETSTMTIDYALRHAVKPLNEFIEADLANGEDVLAEYPDAAMIPLTLYNYDIETGTTTQEYYGLPDSLTFSMMFYRKDVLSSLGLEIPRTWDELLSILPILQYNNMEIGIQNDIYTFIYQSGNEAYADEGLRINFDDSGVLNAFTKMCNMYTQYSLPYTYDFSNRFRTGEMPIGIAPYTQCNQLAVFASELSGLWGFVPLPGYEHVDENGETYINNTAIATVTGCIMLDGCDNTEASWEFMKWYTGTECQVAYSNQIVSIMGIAARPATANTEALIQLPWTAEEAENILLQFENLGAVENHPGSYYLARYVSFAFLSAINERVDPAEALLDYVNTINKEIIRKRQEFGWDYLEIGETLN